MLQVAESRLGVAMMRRHSLASCSAAGWRAVDAQTCDGFSSFGRTEVSKKHSEVYIGLPIVAV